jgi:LDH2 family malate/lactate/ureidoglycolate dehydrogenase
VSRDGVQVPFQDLELFVAAVFAALGVPADEAGLCADVVIAADRWGIASHGVNRVKPYYYDRIRSGLQSPVTHLEVVRDGPTTAVVDGHHGMGQVIASRCMDLAVAKARRFGMGMVAVRNSTHYGIAGYYAWRATEAGLIGICGSNARPCVAPTHATEGLLGTNAVAVGMPTDEPFPFLFDGATSITQRGKIEVDARFGRPTRDGVVIGADGACRTDSSGILRDLPQGLAALLPVGGADEETGSHKGYGASTVVELLSAALQSGRYLRMLSGIGPDGAPSSLGLGHFFLAIDPAAFVPLDEFRRTVGNILRELRAARRSPGSDRVYTAGEKEYEAWLARRDTGLFLNASVRAELVAMRDALGLAGWSVLGVA